MKKMMNLTTTDEDLLRFKDNADLKSVYTGHGLDGVELLAFDEDGAGKVLPEDVVGMHLKYLSYWVCVWNGDEQRIMDEFGDWDAVRKAFGGTGRDAIRKLYADNLAVARRYNPEYGVFHVTDISIKASMDWDFEYTDEQVVKAVIELVNDVYTNLDDGFALLFENLWWPGMTATRPEIVDMLLSGIKHSNRGVMLDIGHLLHTNPNLRTLDESIDYVYRILDRYDNLDFIRGIHLHQTLNGEYVQRIKENPLELTSGYYGRSMGIMSHIFEIDNHKPFISDRLERLIQDIAPEYLVLEFISSSREEHERYLAEQMACLKGL